MQKLQEAYTLSREEFDDIVSLYGEKYFDRTGITYDSDMELYRAGGCENCSHTGYSGRIAIHELMHATADIKSLIKKQANTVAFFEKAAEEGMTTLVQDGIMKAFDGFTDIAEIRRVCIS